MPSLIPSLKIPPLERTAMRRPSGPTVWHGGAMHQRFATPLPASVKGPVRAREVRAAKRVPTPGNRWATPQLQKD